MTHTPWRWPAEIQRTHTVSRPAAKSRSRTVISTRSVKRFGLGHLILRGVVQRAGTEAEELVGEHPAEDEDRRAADASHLPSQYIQNFRQTSTKYEDMKF